MTSLIDHLASRMPPKTALCYFFCTFADQDSLLAKTLSASLVKQILSILGYNIPGVERLVTDALDLRCETDVKRWESLLLHLIVQSRYTIYFLLDGIDECNQEQQFQIFAFLGTLFQEERIRVKLYISSRSEAAPVPRLLEDFDILTLTANHNTADIERFIDYEIQKRQDRQSLIGVSEELLYLIKVTLAEKAQAM